jgi:hypothetical protein
MDKIKLIKNNDHKEWSDLQWVQEFYDFMRGTNPESIGGKPMKLNDTTAFRIIWYLQEHFAIIPDTIEKCTSCKELYDSASQGHHSELTGGFYCSESCEPHNLYERELKAEKKAEKNRFAL